MAAVPETVAAYLAEQPAAARKVLAQVRAAIKAAAPLAKESIAYRIPTYKTDGRMLIYFAGFKGHYSLYPSTKGVIAAGGKALAAHLVSKGTMRFDYAKPVPTALIKKIVRARLAENEVATRSRRARGTAKAASRTGA